MTCANARADAFGRSPVVAGSASGADLRWDMPGDPCSDLLKDQLPDLLRRAHIVASPAIGVPFRLTRVLLNTGRAGKLGRFPPRLRSAAAHVTGARGIMQVGYWSGRCGRFVGPNTDSATGGRITPAHGGYT